jgi:hypothetical protein
MPLTLRPTGLSDDPDAKNWCTYDGYEDRAAPIEESRKPTT